MNHGTKVASIAVFGTDLLNKKLILKPRCNVLNFKIAHDNKENVDIGSAIIKAIEKYKNRARVTRD